MNTYPAFPKIPRLFRDITITEKIDGTNALIYIYELTYVGQVLGDRGKLILGKKTTNDKALCIQAGSRKRWLHHEKKADDNFGFARWVHENADELLGLGVGYHYGEWWGQGIQRGYGLDHKRFSVFNTKRWRRKGENGLYVDAPPNIVDVVPVLYEGYHNTEEIDLVLDELESGGSVAARGYDNPEGIVVFIGGRLFKATLGKAE